MPLPVGAHAIAAHHKHRHTFHEDGAPNMFSIAMHRNRDRADLGAYFREAPGRSLDQSIHIILGEPQPPEPLADNTNAYPFCIGTKRARIRLRPDSLLAWIKPILARDRFKQ